MSGWGDAWRALLDVAGRELQRRVAQGRGYHRSGRVPQVRWSTGAVTGRVQGSRATPYLVETLVPVLDDAAWRRVADALAGQARHTAHLLAGHPPEGLHDELALAGVRLLPTRDEIETSCGCRDAAWPCAHVAALWEAAAAELDEDPFLLLRLRGRGRSRLLSELSDARRRRGASTEPEGLRVASLQVDGWTVADASLDDVGVPSPRPPSTAAPALRLLGDPPGWQGGVEAWRLFSPLVVAASRWIQALDDDARA